MRFWDSSAVFPLIATESSSERMQALVGADDAIAVWWSTEVECVSAVARRERDGTLTPSEAKEALERLDALVGGWTEVDANAHVRRSARRLLRVHALRAADAMQLAAALVAAEAHAESLPFVTLDRRLANAARREGFSVLADDS